MKHPFLDRLLIVVAALVFLGAAVTLGAVGIRTGTAQTLGYALEWLQSGVWRRILACALAVAFAAFGVALFWIILPGGRGQRRNFAVQKNENGSVKISVKALEALVAKCLAQHAELKIISSTLRSDGDAVQVDVHVTLAADISIPLAVAALQKQIKQYLEACSGVDVREVRVIVDNTTDAQESSASPYAIPARLQTAPAFARSPEPVFDPLPKKEPEKTPQKEPEAPAAQASQGSQQQRTEAENAPETQGVDQAMDEEKPQDMREDVQDETDGATSANEGYPWKS